MTSNTFSKQIGLGEKPMRCNFFSSAPYTIVPYAFFFFYFFFYTKKSPITVAQPVRVCVYVYVCATLRNGRVGREKSKKQHVWEEKQLCWFWRAYNITHTRTPFPFFILSHFLCVCPIAMWFCGWTKFLAMISFRLPTQSLGVTNVHNH